MDLKTFKIEFAAYCTDTWGDTMDAWFEIAANLYERGEKIPPEWEYKPGQGDLTEPDTYFHADFKAASTEQLFAIGKYLFSQCKKLKRAGQNY